MLTQDTKPDWLYLVRCLEQYDWVSVELTLEDWITREDIAARIHESAIEMAPTRAMEEHPDLSAYAELAYQRFLLGEVQKAILQLELELKI